MSKTSHQTTIKNPKLLRLAFLIVATLFVIPAMAQGRVARVTKGIFLFSNWDSPHVTLDTCLDMTITEVHIPDAIEHNGRSYPVDEIGHGAFQGCYNLTTVYLDNTHCGFLRDAFRDCPSLRVLVCSSTKPISIHNEHPFYGGDFDDIFEPYHAQSVIVVVPPGSEEAYRNDPGWSRFRTIQSTMPTEEQLRDSDREQRISYLELQLTRARAEVQRLEKELEILKEGAKIND